MTLVKAYFEVFLMTSYTDEASLTAVYRNDHTITDIRRRYEYTSVRDAFFNMISETSRIGNIRIDVDKNLSMSKPL